MHEHPNRRYPPSIEKSQRQMGILKPIELIAEMNYLRWTRAATWTAAAARRRPTTNDDYRPYGKRRMLLGGQTLINKSGKNVKSPCCRATDAAWHGPHNDDAQFNVDGLIACLASRNRYFVSFLFCFHLIYSSRRLSKSHTPRIAPQKTVQSNHSSIATESGKWRERAREVVVRAKY